MLGLITYDAGDVTLLGKAPSELTEEEKQKIGVTLAESGFSGYLKVKDVVPVLTASIRPLTEKNSLDCAGSSGFRWINISGNFPQGMKAKLKGACRGHSQSGFPSHGRTYYRA